MRAHAFMGLVVTGVFLYGTGAWANPEPEPPDAGSYPSVVAEFTLVHGTTPHDATLVWCKNLNDRDGMGMGLSGSISIRRDGTLINPKWVDCGTEECNVYCESIDHDKPLGIWVDKGLSPGVHEYRIETWGTVRVCEFQPVDSECYPSHNCTLRIKIGDYNTVEPDKDAGSTDNYQAEDNQEQESKNTQGTDSSNAPGTSGFADNTYHRAGSGGCDTTGRGASMPGIMMLFFLVLFLGCKGMRTEK